MSNQSSQRQTIIQVAALVACLVAGLFIVWQLAFSGRGGTKQIVVGEAIAPGVRKPASRPAPTSRPTQKEFLDAIDKGELAKFKTLLEADPLLVKVEVKQDGYATPLHYAAVTGNIEMVRTLLEAGANLHAVEDQHNGTPLEWAVFAGKIEMVEYLLSLGAKVDDYILQVAVAGARGDFFQYTKTPREVYPKITRMLLAAQKNPVTTRPATQPSL